MLLIDFAGIRPAEKAHFAAVQRAKTGGVTQNPYSAFFDVFLQLELQKRGYCNHMIWLTAIEAGQHLKLKPRTVIELARTGKIPGYVVSGTARHTWRFIESEIDAAMMGSPVVPRKDTVN